MRGATSEFSTCLWSFMHPCGMKRKRDRRKDEWEFKRSSKGPPIVLQLSVVREGHVDSLALGKRPRGTDGERERWHQGEKRTHAFICPPLVQTTAPLTGYWCVCVYMCELKQQRQEKLELWCFSIHTDQTLKWWTNRALRVRDCQSFDVNLPPTSSVPFISADSTSPEALRPAGSRGPTGAWERASMQQQGPPS